MLLSFRVSLFIQSWQWREFYYFVSLGIKKKERKKETINEDLSLLIYISPPKLHNAPLISIHQDNERKTYNE